MGEQIPCPVCTLFLHPGMNLADHLETHPKEQVIKALVSLAVGLQPNPTQQAIKPSPLVSVPVPAPAPPLIQNLSTIDDGHNPNVVASNEAKLGFLTPHNRNVMIVNRQTSTMVYQSTSSNANHQRMIPQGMSIAPPPLQIFNLPQQDAAAKFLPPPPAYGTAVHQLRSQNHHQLSSSHFHSNQQQQQQQLTEANLDNSYYDISNNQNHAENCISRRQSPRLSQSTTSSWGGSPSPRPSSSPSVLRYAESPVTAQYVERENGDFIVQETPRHIVECVEKDDGQFSVIEKVIRSPPSVISFNDDDNDNDHSDFESNENSYSGSDLNDKVEEIEVEQPVLPPRRNSVAASVTVLSNVKLAPKESLNLMENIIALKKPGTQILLSSIIKAEEIEKPIENPESNLLIEEQNAEDRMDEHPDNMNENFNENSKETASSSLLTPLTASILHSPSHAGTSVIRIATIQKMPNKLGESFKQLEKVENSQKTDKLENSQRTEKLESPNKNLEKSESPRKIEKPESSQNSDKIEKITSREPVKRIPFKKTPKKLVVKFKNPPRIDNDNNINPEPGPLDYQLKSITNVEKTKQNKIIEEVSELNRIEEENATISIASKIHVGKDDDVMIEEQENSPNIEDKLPDYIDPENNEIEMIDNCNLTTNLVEEKCMEGVESHENVLPKLELDGRRTPVVIVHEPSLLEEPEIETQKKDEEKSDYKKDLELSKLLVECMKNNTPESYTTHLPPADSTSDGIQEIVSVNTNVISAGVNKSSTEISQRNDSMTSIQSLPSTSFSKPSASASFFNLREQTNFPSSHSYNDYPFSFLYANNDEKNCLSPIYPSEEQSWNRFNGPIFQQNAQILLSEDGEKSCYIDLDACKKNSSTSDTFPSVDALNIRTDEKMPAKGEISEQESNGEIDISWSQMIYNENQQPQNQVESFGNRESGYGTDGFFFSPQNLNNETKPERSDIQIDIIEQKPTPIPLISTETSQETSKERTIQRKTVTIKKRKSFQCDHCMQIFAKLKDRNSHLIDKHNYKRVNRRLVRDVPPATVTTLQAAEELQQQQQQQLEQQQQQQQDQQHQESNIINAIDIEEKKPEILTISSVESSHLPRTKYDSIRAGVYRMLMNYNLNVLQQNRDVQVDQSLFDSKSFFCYTCRRDFISVKSFDEHLTEHPAECFTCSKKFTRWTYFSVHLKRHLGWKDFGCTVCSKRFVIRSALIEHMRMHTGITPLKCKFCDKYFKRYSNLTQHKRVCHTTKCSIKKDYVCHCGEVLPSKARFIWHKETHDTKPKCCPHCRDRFVHTNSLRRHIRLAHSDKFSYSEPTECPICNQVYAKTSLKAHMSTHSLDTQHECVICNKSFSTKWNLKIHSWVHANRTAKPFKCELCVKAFVREIDYKNHMNSHKQIKPYTCEYCGCKFIRKYNYIRHSREHHGQKKFSCDLCGKLFHRHYYLVEHRRTHTGERPFLCPICGKSSTTKTNHNKHLKIHHSRDPFTTET